MILAFLFCTCAALPTNPAPWDSSPSAIRQLFPDDEYIAQRGQGATRAAAEAQAASELARFLTSQISVSRGYQIVTTNAGENISTHDEAYINSQINLFGIRYADDAYYRKDLREWRTVAWIERAEAWAVYGPGFRRQADSFLALFNAAEDEKDTFKKALLFMAADSFSRTSAFEDANLFGQILDPGRMNTEFGLVRTNLAALPQKLDSAKRSASVYIDCPLDFESLVSNAFAASFSALGFPVASTPNNAAAVCRITVDEGMQQRDLGIFYNPSLRAVITGLSGTIFSYTAEAERASAVTPDVAKRRAYQSLADEVNKTFSLDASIF